MALAADLGEDRIKPVDDQGIEMQVGSIGVAQLAAADQG
jgi:hypothetical protein